MGITISIQNDSKHKLVGRLDGVKGTICKLEILPGNKWSRTDNGIRRASSYSIRVWKNNKGRKYTYHLISPASKGELLVKASDILMSKSKSGIMKATHKLSMDGQLHAAIGILKVFTKKNAMDLKIPPEVIYGAKGLAFLTQTKVGFFLSVSGGLGIVIVRGHDGTWTGPSAFGCAGVGAGIQFGANVTRSLLILNNMTAVKAFSGGGQVKLGASLSVAAGPMGREAGLEARAGKGKVAACFSYAITQGLFGGVSLDGAILTPRKSENKKFYGSDVKISDILNGKVKPPENTRLKELYVELKKIESETGMQIDGRMHVSKIAAMVVFCPEEVEDLLAFHDQCSHDSKEQIAHILAPLEDTERLEINHARSMAAEILHELMPEHMHPSRRSFAFVGLQNSEHGSWRESKTPDFGGKGTRPARKCRPELCENKVRSLSFDGSQKRGLKSPTFKTPILTRSSLTPSPRKRRNESTGISPRKPTIKALISAIKETPEQTSERAAPDAKARADAAGPANGDPELEVQMKNTQHPDRAGDVNTSFDAKAYHTRSINVRSEGVPPLTMPEGSASVDGPSESQDCKAGNWSIQIEEKHILANAKSMFDRKLKGRHRRNSSKAIHQMKALLKENGFEMNILKHVARFLFNQFEKQDFRGYELVQWILEGKASVMHKSIKTENDRLMFLLAQTLVSGEDKKEVNLNDEDSEVERRLLELRVYVLLNLLLEFGYIEQRHKRGDSKLDPSMQHKLVHWEFDPLKKFSFTAQIPGVVPRPRRFSIFKSQGSSVASSFSKQRASSMSSQRSARSPCADRDKGSLHTSFTGDDDNGSINNSFSRSSCRHHPNATDSAHVKHASSEDR